MNRGAGVIRAVTYSVDAWTGFIDPEVEGFVSTRLSEARSSFARKEVLG